ncbi:hypothetical protein PV682_32325 [Streptomyces niveiscabiei]|nr:hypothetical protein [Streptomyces niveiscabiei]MDX3386109.1 hypothetical protein [Streptomyces niveiscabiei]
MRHALEAPSGQERTDVTFTPVVGLIVRCTGDQQSGWWRTVAACGLR